MWPWPSRGPLFRCRYSGCARRRAPTAALLPSPVAVVVAVATVAVLHMAVVPVAVAAVAVVAMVAVPVRGGRARFPLGKLNILEGRLSKWDHLGPLKCNVKQWRRSRD